MIRNPMSSNFHLHGARPAAIVALAALAGCVSQRAEIAESERQAAAASERGDWLAAGELWHRVWVETGSDNPRYGLELARALYRQGDTAAAGKVIEASLAVAPSDPELHELRADVFVAEARWSEAAASYERVTAADPARAKAWRRLGELRLRTGDPNGAMDALERAALLEPYEHGVFLLIAEAADQAGNPDRTLHALARAIAAGEDSPPILARAGLLGAERALSGTEPNFAVMAIDWLEQAVSLDPQRADAWLALGRLYRLRLEPERAIEAVRRAVELEPTQLLAVLELAELYAAQRETERVAELVQRALDLGPDEAARVRLDALVPPSKVPEPSSERQDATGSSL